MGRKRINPFIAMGIRARKRREQKKREEEKKLARMQKINMKIKRANEKAIAKKVAKIRKQTTIQYN